MGGWLDYLGAGGGGGGGGPRVEALGCGLGDACRGGGGVVGGGEGGEEVGVGPELVVVVHGGVSVVEEVEVEVDDCRL